MAALTDHPSCPALHIARVPGELGPVVRCSGELTVATGEALKRQLDLLASLRLPALILNLSGCRSLDMDGALLLLTTYRRLNQQGRRFAIVAGTEAMARILALLGIDSVIPVFATEAAAAESLRGSCPDEPKTRPQERGEALSMWRSILAALEEGPAEEIRRRIHAYHSHCRPADEDQPQGQSAEKHCRLCLLFHALGARTEDIECHGISQPMLDALCKEDHATARTHVSRLIDLVEAMPLSQG